MGALGSGPEQKDPKELEAKGTLNKSRARKREREAEGSDPRALHIPKPPDTMTPGARAHYQYFAEMAYARKVMTDEDRTALVELCETYAMLLRTRHALNKLSDDDLIIIDKKGKGKEHPLLRSVTVYQKNLAGWLARFGLTPADAGRVKAIKPSRESKTADPEAARWDRLN